MKMRGRAGRERGIPFEHYKGGEGFPFSITREDTSQLPRAPRSTKGYSSTYLAMGLANVRAGTWSAQACQRRRCAGPSRTPSLSSRSSRSPPVRAPTPAPPRRPRLPSSQAAGHRHNLCTPVRYAVCALAGCSSPACTAAVCPPRHALSETRVVANRSRAAAARGRLRRARVLGWRERGARNLGRRRRRVLLRWRRRARRGRARRQRGHHRAAPRRTAAGGTLEGALPPSPRPRPRLPLPLRAEEAVCP